MATAKLSPAVTWVILVRYSRPYWPTTRWGVEFQRSEVPPLPNWP